MRLRIGLLVLFVAGCTQSHDAPASGGEVELNTGETPTTVPVLVFPERYMQSAAFMTGERWYAVHFEGEGLVLDLHATNNFVERPADLDPAAIEHDARVRGHGAFDTVDEGIRVISWTENGAAYSLDVTCIRQDDERCTESAFAVALANELEARR